MRSEKRTKNQRPEQGPPQFGSLKRFQNWVLQVGSPQYKTWMFASSFSELSALGALCQHLPDSHLPIRLGFSLDVKAAHKRIVLHPDEQGLVGFTLNDRLYFHRVAPFRAVFSAHWWARSGGFLLRIFHRLMWWAHSGLLYVDDYFFTQCHDMMPISATMLCLFCQICKIPISWAKCELGSSLQWIGWHFRLMSGCIDMPRERLRVTCGLAQEEALVSHHLDSRGQLVRAAQHLLRFLLVGPDGQHDFEHADTLKHVFHLTDICWPQQLALPERCSLVVLICALLVFSVGKTRCSCGHCWAHRHWSHSFHHGLHQGKCSCASFCGTCRQHAAPWHSKFGRLIGFHEAIDVGSQIATTFCEANKVLLVVVVAFAMRPHRSTRQFWNGLRRFNCVCITRHNNLVTWTRWLRLPAYPLPASVYGRVITSRPLVAWRRLTRLRPSVRRSWRGPLAFGVVLPSTSHIIC